jgi:hypothetical protein
VQARAERVIEVRKLVDGWIRDVIHGVIPQTIQGIDSRPGNARTR